MEERKKQNYKLFYDIIEVIGSGAYGCVYKGREKKTNQLRAIKAINLDLIEQNLLIRYEQKDIAKQLSKCIDGFILEFENMKLCSQNNENSVKCYEYFSNKESFVIIMELCDENLSKLFMDKFVKQKSSFNDKDIYDIMQQLNKAFTIMKLNNIIHRDLKLENILIKFSDNEKKNYTLKISDYGCSKRLSSLTNNYCKTYTGTMIYMAPEILQGKDYNYKCDLWSIGIIIYRLLFGNSPFYGETDLELIKNIDKFDNNLLRKTGNKELDDLIMKLLEKNIEKRINWEDYFNHKFFKNNEIIINLVYEKEKFEIKSNENDNAFDKIFGKNFVENNKNNIELEINGIKSELIEETKLKIGINNIKMIIKNKLTKLEYMFDECYSLKNIEQLKYLDTTEINDFSYMFNGCSLKNLKGLENWNASNGQNFSHIFWENWHLSDINALKNWNVSNGKNFECMFHCLDLEDINVLKNWNVSNGQNFSYMFYNCAFNDIEAIKNWNVSNGINFSYMFGACSELSNLNYLQNLNVSNGNNFGGMFDHCKSLSDLKGLINWNVSNGNDFSYMFKECLSLKKLEGLEKWNVSKGNNFSNMFGNSRIYELQNKSLSDINALRNWNVSYGNNFSSMFSYNISLSNIKSLENWNVSNGNNFSEMFKGCKLLSDLRPLENWNVSNGKNFSEMFFRCKLTNLNGLEKWNISKGINFSYMFFECNLLADINALKNWNISKEQYFEGIFYSCFSLKDKTILRNWNVPKDILFDVYI